MWIFGTVPFKQGLEMEIVDWIGDNWIKAVLIFGIILPFSIILGKIFF